MSTVEAVEAAEAAEAQLHGGIESLMLDFLAYLELERGLSRNTLEAYRSDLLQFGRFLEVRGVRATDATHSELAEEIGRGAKRWEPIVVYYTGAGFTDERVHLFAATELYEAHADSGENERIELVPWPLARLDEAIAECRDAKTLIGLYWLARRLNA